MLARALVVGLLPVALFAMTATSHAQVVAAPLVPETKIPLGPVGGRIDHLAVDLKRRRLFIAELGNDSVGWSIWRPGGCCEPSAASESRRASATNHRRIPSMSRMPGMARCIYVSCGAGEVDVLAPRGEGYHRIARVPTASGARTALFVPELDRLFVAARGGWSEPAAIWVFRPMP